MSKFKKGDIVRLKSTAPDSNKMPYTGKKFYGVDCTVYSDQGVQEGHASTNILVGRFTEEELKSKSYSDTNYAWDDMLELVDPPKTDYVITIGANLSIELKSKAQEMVDAELTYQKNKYGYDVIVKVLALGHAFLNSREAA